MAPSSMAVMPGSFVTSRTPLGFRYRQYSDYPPHEVRRLRMADITILEVTRAENIAILALSETSKRIDQMPDYIEKDCTFSHDGRTFEAGGAVVTSELLIAYPAANG